MFDATVRDGVCQCRHAGARWLVTGWDGGYRDADAAYNVTVPDGFDRTDLADFRDERLRAVGFEDPGPALLTGVSMAHARCASAGPVTALATAGVSNPAALPVDPASSESPAAGRADDCPSDWRPGTVNLVVGAERALADGTLAELLATCVEAKAATLSDLAGVPGTTSDAVAVGCVPDADPVDFAGSATDVGGRARACVRDAVRASFASRYAEAEPPNSVADAEYGVVTDRETDVWNPADAD
ncbi:adenosylcobinamide hydrolase [Halomicrobium zhouii]|uniref:Adenosylcobinamide hydrolase n=1 Tax=Halomicrobium zhouii TaxID=767519 RepID=A0A1I6L7K8_9EURY|nr:adenosylcobinamide amidohydrolase [Halomicrobium zhouii]SFR99449.1 adenosylcobinamide hydrolase [Halomicrobium zhouii]